MKLLHKKSNCLEKKDENHSNENNKEVRCYGFVVIFFQQKLLVFVNIFDTDFNNCNRNFSFLLCVHYFSIYVSLPPSLVYFLSSLLPLSCLLHYIFPSSVFQMLRNHKSHKTMAEQHLKMMKLIFLKHKNV